MPYNGSGVFSILNSFVPNTTILSASVNANYSDIATGLSDVLTRDGQAGMTANLAMGTNKITGLGTPSASTDGATKGYVDTQFLTAWSTGDVKLTLKTVADSGWVLFTDGTIGDGSSGATYAAADASALFTLLYNSPFVDATAPLFTSTGSATTRGAQGTAASAFAAHCRISTLKTLGRALAIAGSGSGLTARTMGLAVGLETATLITGNLPAYTPAGTIVSNVTGGTVGGTTFITSVPTNSSGSDTPWTHSNIVVTSTFTGTAQGGTSTPVAIMDPTQYVNAMVKL